MDIAALARNVLNIMAKDEQTAVLEFADAEVALLDALRDAGHLTVSQREFADVEPAAEGVDLVYVVSPVADIEADEDQCLSIDPTTGSVALMP